MLPNSSAISANLQLNWAESELNCTQQILIADHHGHPVDERDVALQAVRYDIFVRSLRSQDRPRATVAIPEIDFTRRKRL